MTSLIQALPSVISTLVDMLPDIVDVVINGLVDAIIKATPILVKQAPYIIKAFAKGLLNSVKVIASAGTRLIEALGSAISSAITSLGKKVVSFAKKIPDGIKKGLGNLKSIGTNLIEGLWGGIKSKFDAVVNKVRELASKLPAAVKKVLGIASPSKVFMEVGKWIPEGLALGIEKNMKVVEDASDAMADATTFIPSDSESYGIMGSGSSVQINNYITVDGAENPEDFASRFVRQMKMEMRTV